MSEVKARARKHTDISGHLVTLFVESWRARPKLIVELGVGHGESTFVFERVARLCGAVLVGLDTEDRNYACDYEAWNFVQRDDIEFAAEFDRWCGERGIEPKIDVLLVDTSHLYDHTVEEIRCWFPHLSERAKVFFHDTNMREYFYRRDGSIGLGWDNERGVIRALEGYFGVFFDEKREFVDYRDGWLITHDPLCNGLTILERVPSRCNR